MIDLLKLWARRVVPVTAALALVVGFGGFAQAHDDEDDDDDAPPIQYYHDWHAGPHVGPHSGCHWSPDYGYHCGPHVTAVLGLPLSFALGHEGHQAECTET